MFPIKLPELKPNVIFGVLTNGEIYVEVNGQQHTPADAFYKMATIQSTKLAHQVRDLIIQNENLAKENATLRDQRGADKTALYSISEILDKWHEVEE